MLRANQFVNLEQYSSTNKTIVACENSRPSASLPARVAFRETRLGPGAKLEDGCFRWLEQNKDSESGLKRAAFRIKKSAIVRYPGCALAVNL